MKESMETMHEVSYFTIDHAEGTIEAKNNQQERLEEFTQRAGSGEFHVATDCQVPCGCVDGRCGGKIRPNAAGGTETIFVADDLTTKRFEGDGTTASAYRTTLRLLKDEGFEVGGHDDDHAMGDISGCGANDKLPLIYDFIQRKADVLKDLTESLGITVDDASHQTIVDNARARTEFSKGAELLGVLNEEGAEDAVDHLRGGHNEVMVIINLREGTTFDRDAAEAEFGPDYEAFNVDAWSFAEAARATSLSPQEAEQKVVAMVYYNLATAHVLGGKSLRVVVLK